MSELPRRKTTSGELIDTRPMYVEEWLDTLPYLDFKKTASLIEQALAATNQEDIKASTRLELISLYHRPYEYYLESQIKAGAQHTLQTIDAMQSQVNVMKQIAVHLGYSCKLAFDKSQSHKSVWKSNKPPYEALLMSMNYLSQALIFSYLEYSPVPKNVWKQLHFIYDLAESSKCEKKQFSIPGPGDRQNSDSFEHCYKRILMASLVDPHHLPFGAIWEIYELLDSWVKPVTITAMREVSEPPGHFVLDLRADRKPVPYKKFNLEKVTESSRLLDASELLKQVRNHLGNLEAGKGLDKSVELSPFYARTLLNHMNTVWGLSPSRNFQRQAKQGKLELYAGIETVYYFLNGKKAFERQTVNNNETDIDITDVDMQQGGTAGDKHYQCDAWQIVDQSSGGAALIRKEKPEKSIKVGQLVAIPSDSNQENWTLALVRWLMISRDVHKVGIEYVSHHSRPISIRATEGSKADREYRPALLVQYRDDASKLSIITEKGLYIEDRELSVVIDNKEKTISAGTLLESGVACEIYTFRK